MSTPPPYKVPHQPTHSVTSQPKQTAVGNSTLCARGRMDGWALHKPLTSATHTVAPQCKSLSPLERACLVCTCALQTWADHRLHHGCSCAHSHAHHQPPVLPHRKAAGFCAWRRARVAVQVGDIAAPCLLLCPITRWCSSIAAKVLYVERCLSNNMTAWPDKQGYGLWLL
jgi:hypothetical protein